jgi:hypothetical protein
MNFRNENIGVIERTPAAFVQTMNGEVKEFKSLPPILCGIAPEPTQFPAANEVLEYYNMNRLDVWKYLARSNGFKTSRDVWFMAEPRGEVWMPLVLGMQRYTAYDALFKIGDAVRVFMNGKAYANRHTIDVFPQCVKPYLLPDGDTRFSTATGYVKDLVPYPSIKGMVGRIVLNFPTGQ